MGRKATVNDKITMNKYYLKNREKYDARNRKWAKEHPEKIKEYGRNWQKNNPEKARSNRLKYKYGITLDEYNIIYVNQNGVCAICRKINFRNLVVDHHHITGKVRGLLCDNCNVVLGLIGEQKEIAQDIIKYLETR